MCESCGCNVTIGNRHLISFGGKLSQTNNGKQAINLLNDLLDENNHEAEHNRHHFRQHRVLAVNLMSSPGAGKTSLLEATIAALKTEFCIGVIEGDLETENDAQRIRAHGIAAIQICTGSACHLDAHMVHQALHHLDLAQTDIVFIENVGNLVCPASFDLGQQFNVALLSVPEGDDKPAKYPVMFRVADRVLLSKTDLLEYITEFSIERAQTALRELASEAPMLLISSKTGDGMQPWFNWLRAEVAHIRQQSLTHTAKNSTKLFTNKLPFSDESNQTKTQNRATRKQSEASLKSPL